MRFDGQADARPLADSCAFCAHDALEVVLAETEHFLVLADNAPLVEGHLLLVPRRHYACFGALPADLDAEVSHLKRVVASFCAEVYRPPIFFEHGVFGQSVFHAHLHAVPLGPSGLHVHALAEPDGASAYSQADVRAWYAARGHYFYLESPITEHSDSEAAIFPPQDGAYRRVLAMLRERSNAYNPWLPQFARRASGAAKMRSLAEKWRAFEA